MFKTKIATTIVYTLLLCQYAIEASRIKSGGQPSITRNANEAMNDTIANDTATKSRLAISKDMIEAHKNFTVLKLKSNVGNGQLIFGDLSALENNGTHIGNKDGFAKGNFSTFQMFKELPLVGEDANKNKTGALVGTTGAAANIMLTNKDGSVNQTIKMSTMQSTFKHSNLQKMTHARPKRLHSKMHHDSFFNRHHAHRPRHLKNPHLLEDKTEFPERHFGIDFIQSHNGNRQIEVDTDMGNSGKSISPMSISKMFNLANLLLGDVDPLGNRAPYSCASEEFTFIGNKPQTKLQISRSVQAQPKNFASPHAPQEGQVHCPVHNRFGSLAKDIFGICTCGIMNA